MARAPARVAPKSKPTPQLPPALMAELERRRAGLARHMARAVVAVVKWDASTGVPPQREAIAKACEAGLDLFLATAREARPATPEELRRVAQLGILQARSSQSVEPILAAYRIAARVAWEEILRAWRGHPDATPEAIMLTANYVFAAPDQVAPGFAPASAATIPVSEESRGRTWRHSRPSKRGASCARTWSRTATTRSSPTSSSPRTLAWPSGSSPTASGLFSIPRPGAGSSCSRHSRPT